MLSQWCPVLRWREPVAGAGMEEENLLSRYWRLEVLGRFGLWSSEGGPQVVIAASGRVPMRDAGADWPVVATKAL